MTEEPLYPLAVTSKKNHKPLAVVLVSGGMDSTTLAYALHAKGWKLHLVGFNYGQRHAKELTFAVKTAEYLHSHISIVDLTSLGVIHQQIAIHSGVEQNVLTGEGEVPEGHYAQENMVKTVVPNRNAIMLAVAFSIASARGAEVVATAVHGGDHFIYPDCRPDFIYAFDQMEIEALDGIGPRGQAPHLVAPFLHSSKATIALEGAKYEVPFELTWSCYKGGNWHCGRCGTCVERAEAFHAAGVEDPTHYDDPDYWKQALSDHYNSLESGALSPNTYL